MDGYGKQLADVDLKKLGKKAGVIALLGITGLTVLGAINLYRFSRGMETLSLDGDNWWK